MSIELPQKAKDLIDKPEMAVISTVNKDGSPQASVVWATRDGDDVLFNTARTRAKLRNLERDPRISVLVYSSEDPYFYVEVRGTASFEDDPEGAMIHRLSHKYQGTDFPLPPDQERVTIRVTPQKVVLH